MSADGAGVKVLTAGTHRTRTAQETWAAIEPMFPRMGITRVADVTRLDNIGIPVYLAVRPDSKNLSVSQGKGITPDQARVSAAMESVESWHSEGIRADRIATLREIESELTYDISALDLHRPSVLYPDLKLGWTAAVALSDGGTTWLPTELLCLEFWTTETWHRSVFFGSSNGLASGNTLDEAMLHGLLELIERDSETRALATEFPLIIADSIDHGYAGELMNIFRTAAVQVTVRDQTGPTGIPCYAVEIWSADLPSKYSGSGCHPDADVAMCRALTEAAQARLTYISGARDDLSDKGFRWARRPTPISSPDETNAKPWRYEAGVTTTIEDDLRATVDAATQVAGTSPLAVDLTRPDIGISVARVIAPGLTWAFHLHA